MPRTERVFTIYCDGASRKDGRGGWGYIAYEGFKPLRERYGGAFDTTNNRMELQAAIEALKSFSLGAKLIVISDSKYVVEGVLEHADLWLRTGWRTSSNKEVKNKDLWEELLYLDVDRVIDWRWVKGHTGVAGNERADYLAGLGVPDK